jgi:hypothetical protein
MAQLTFFEQSLPSTLVDITRLMEVRLAEKACSGRRVAKPVSFDQPGSKIDSHVQIGHNMAVGGYCLLVAQIEPAGRGIIAIERLVRDGTANPKGEGRE